MASLYFHTLPGAAADAVTRAATGARWVKLCDSGQIARVQALGCRCYYRPYLSGADNGDCGDGAAWAGDVWADLRNNGSPQPECIVMRNECNASVNTGAQYLRFRDALRRFGYRGIVVLGSFAVGTPDWPEWAALKAGLGGYPPDAIDAHEYWDLSVGGSATYYALRHVEAIRRGLLPPEWPVFVGECGSDAIWRALPAGGSVPVEDPQGRRGWQDRGKLTAAQQSANLAAYAAGCAPSVVAAYVFADGTADPNWATFRTFDTPVETAIRGTWPGNAPQSRQDAAHGTVVAQTAPAPVVTPHAPVATPAGPAGRNHALSIDNIPEMNQGPTSLCWAETTQEAFAGAGYSVSVYDLYKQVKGVDYVAPGLPATFAELTQCVQVAARLTGATVKWFGAVGRVNDFATFDQLLRDGSWVVVVGANEQVLVNDLGLAENAGYGHYFICKHIDFNADGTPDTYTIDSYRAFDNVPVRIPLGAVHDAMRQNWDANYDALAYSIK